VTLLTLITLTSTPGPGVRLRPYHRTQHAFISQYPTHFLICHSFLDIPLKSFVENLVEIYEKICDFPIFLYYYFIMVLHYHEKRYSHFRVSLFPLINYKYYTTYSTTLYYFIPYYILFPLFRYYKPLFGLGQ